MTGIGWNETGGEGIAEIADIARHRHGRESNTLPLINGDDTDFR
jgi:hypothetical protein